MVGDFIILLSSLGRLTRQNIIKKARALNDELEELKLIDLFRVLCLPPKLNTYSSPVHLGISQICYMLGHNSNICKIKKKIEIIPSTFSDQKVTKVKITKSGEEINYLESKQHTIK